MQGPVSASNKKTWQIAFDLDAPSLSSQAVQYSIFDEDPVPAFIAQVKRTRSHAREQLEKANSEVDKEQVNAVQMEVGWDLGFKESHRRQALPAEKHDPIPDDVQWPRRQKVDRDQDRAC